MFSKGQIDTWLELHSYSDNKEYRDENPVTHELGQPFLKRHLVEAKVMIDRWDTVTTDWVFHSSRKEMIEKLFELELSDKTTSPLLDALDLLTKFVASMDHEGSSKELETVVDSINAKATLLKSPTIWGAKIHFTDHINPNLGLGLSLKDGQLDQNDSGKLANSTIVFDVWG